MNTITNAAEIETALKSFAPSTDGAFATCRLIPGASSALDPQEWAERGTIGGEPATVYYIFSQAEASGEDADGYPWDTEHVDRIDVGEDA